MKVSEMGKAAFFPENKYMIVNRTGDQDYIVLVVAFTLYRNPFSSNEFPTAKVEECILSFRDRHGAWSEEKGVRYLFAIPKDKIEILNPKGSRWDWTTYPVVKIDEKEITLSTGGGTTDQPGWWADWFYDRMDTLCNLDIESVRHLAKASIEWDKEDAKNID